MPALQVNKLSYHLDNGTKLFDDISFTLPRGVTALIGRNGAGKSILASLLSGDIKPSHGVISTDVSVQSFSQSNSISFQQDETIASFLGIDKQLSALHRVEQGSHAEADFELIDDNWEIKLDTLKIIEKLRLPNNLERRCISLSGGERTTLSLWTLFQSDAKLLILDEPSNHLDKKGKQWLINQMTSFAGDVLVISHDREILQEVDSIFELSSLGLSYFHGNYSDYLTEKQNNSEALERKLINLKKQKRNALNEMHNSKVKAQKRASQGNKLRTSGSQAKVLLDSKKNKAEKSSSSRTSQSKATIAEIDRKKATLMKKKEIVKPLSLSIRHEKGKNIQQLFLEDVVLPFGSAEKLNFKVTTNEKIHLVGENGSGKSTLLKIILGQLKPKNGKVNVNAKTFYCDQHFSLLAHSLTMLECMEIYCTNLNEVEVRSILAGVGFRGDKVFRPIAHLSGGEKMRLMILIASHQIELPLLLLDEPDNHLDIASKNVLANALNEFKGSFILISHDEYLVNHINPMSKIQLR